VLLKGKKMGYSSPKKQLDLNEFLAQPGKPLRRPNVWKSRGSSSGGNSNEDDAASSEQKLPTNAKRSKKIGT